MRSVRTGRDRERSAQLAAEATAANPARTVAAVLDLLPRGRGFARCEIKNLVDDGIVGGEIE